MKSVLAALSPCRHPKRWFAINFFVLAWSAVLLFYIIIYRNRDENDHEKTDTEWSYLIYNFVACIGECAHTAMPSAGPSVVCDDPHTRPDPCNLPTQFGVWR